MVQRALRRHRTAQTRRRLIFVASRYVLPETLHMLARQDGRKSQSRAKKSSMLLSPLGRDMHMVGMLAEGVFKIIQIATTVFSKSDIGQVRWFLESPVPRAPSTGAVLVFGVLWIWFTSFTSPNRALGRLGMV